MTEAQALRKQLEKIWKSKGVRCTHHFTMWLFEKDLHLYGGFKDKVGLYWRRGRKAVI